MQRTWTQRAPRLASCKTRHLEDGDLLVVDNSVPLWEALSPFRGWNKTEGHSYPVAFARTDDGEVMVNLVRGMTVWLRTELTEDLAKTWTTDE